MHEERGSLDLNDSEADSACETEFDFLADSGENVESDLEVDSAADSVKNSAADSAASQSIGSAG